MNSAGEVFNLPDGHRVRMRTTNGLERLNKQLKRRTRVATVFPTLIAANGWSAPC